MSLKERGVLASNTYTGPGIPDLEIEVLQLAEETPVKHGQGLGMWLIKWGIDRLGGTIDIEASSSGTEVTITLPAAHLTTESAIRSSLIV